MSAGAVLSRARGDSERARDKLTAEAGYGRYGTETPSLTSTRTRWRALVTATHHLQHSSHAAASPWGKRVLAGTRIHTRSKVSPFYALHAAEDAPGRGPVLTNRTHKLWGAPDAVNGERQPRPTPTAGGGGRACVPAMRW